MTAGTFLVTVAAVLGFYYWLAAMRSKETARKAGKNRCDEEGVAFLDDSVVQRELALRRTARGGFAFQRKYLFEFSSDGSRRHRGEIELLGHRVLGVTLEPYPVSAWRR